MPTIQDARKVLRDAEATLKELIEQCLAEKRYGDVAAIAALAEGTARLVQDHSERKLTVPIPATSPATAPPVAVPIRGHVRPTGKTAKKGYPLFFSDGNRLVKIGWSKKTRAEYEHRTSRDVPALLVSAIRSKVPEGDLFAATDVIPLGLETGTEGVPDYQAYLALKWLDTVGVISKSGRDRYALVPGALGPNGLDELWQQLPTFKGRKTTRGK